MRPKHKVAAQKKIHKLAQISLPHCQVAFNYEPETNNVWYFSHCDQRYGFSYPGRIPGQIIVNFLHLYTLEGDVIIDPFAGSGTTIDICKLMERQCYAYDIAPARPDVEYNDVTEGLPLLDQCAHAIFLDPPYWKQKRGEYTDRPTDLSNMSHVEFFIAIHNLAWECWRVLVDGGVVGIIISQLKENGRVYDLALQCYEQFRAIGFILEERIIIPYEHAESDTGFWHSWAKKNRFLLRKYRDLMIFRKANSMEERAPQEE